MKNYLTLISLVLALVAVSSGQNLKTEEIVAKHLASIGSEKARGAGTNISIVGEATFAQARQSSQPVVGRCVLASEGTKELFAMTFPLSTYSMEKVVSDGKDMRVDAQIAGARSVLGQYLYDNQVLIKGGLFGGVLNKGWALNDLAGRKARLSPDGTKKIDGKDAYVFNYELSKGTGINIKLYFDKESFRHVRTEYSRVVSAQMGPTPELSAKQSETYQNLTEEFSDFKTENGLTLPRSVKLTLFFQTGKGVREDRYTLALKDIYYDQELDPATFLIK